MRIRASAMVGRDVEFHMVEQALDTARAGRGGAVFVVGEGGIGKSRLAVAAADRGFAIGMNILRGRGSAIGPMVPFRSLTEALMSLLRDGTQVDISMLGPYRRILARLIPDLGPPPAGEDSPSPPVLAEAVLRLTGLAGQGRGCLLILDDLQDADAETLAIVEYLADNLGLQPTMLLGTVRNDPGSALDLARSAAQRGSGLLIELHRLGAEDMRRLAGSYLGIDPGDVPDQVTEHLWTSSAGIPLLAEDLLSGMLRDGQLVEDDPCWRVTGPLRATVPVTLARAMTGRLDRIDVRGRQLLSVAALLGQRFPLAVLHAATGMSDRDLLSYLHADLTAQLVAPDKETPDWYAFQHPLIVDVLLSLLTPAQRSQLAGQAADAVETVYPGRPGEWRQACAALRLQAGDPARAGRLFAAAGHRAMAQGAANSAVTLLDKALELLTRDSDAPARADAFADLLYALAEAGLVERAVSSTGELEKVAGLLSRRSRARLHTRLAWAVAVRHHLRIEEIHALIRLGSDDALRDGSLDRLEQASLEASQAGAVSARYQADASIALQAVLQGDFAAAEMLLDQVLEATMRLKLVETTQYALLARAILGAHRGRRRSMDAALAELRFRDGPLDTPRVYGLARAWCSLLEEDRSRALQELSLALATEKNNPSIFQLTGRYGLNLLLNVLDGTAGQQEYLSITTAPVSKLRWDRQFALFARAVLAGRVGQPATASAAVAEALQAAAPFATARHLGLRLVSEAAIADGWGRPVEWLRAAEEYFHAAEVPSVASACRALLRRAGAPVAQHRRGQQDIPAPLRSAGVTVREHEVLQLLMKRLSNREIAARMHLSPRTVEKHVASLIIKTGQPDRIALGEFGAAISG